MTPPRWPQPTQPGQLHPGAYAPGPQNPPYQAHPGPQRHPGPYPRQQPYHPAAPAYPARPHARYSAPPTPAPRRRGRGWLALVVGLLIVAALAAAGVLLAGVRSDPGRAPDTGSIAQPSTLVVFELQAGDCYRSTQAPPPPGRSQPISVVEAVPCSAPHTNQVIGKITYSATEFPAGVPAAKADAACSTEFQAALDPAAYADPTLKPGRLTPADVATWTATPVVACVVFSDDPISRSLLR